MRVELEICPKVLKGLHKEKTTSSKWLACWAGHTQFEVKKGLQSIIVDMEKRHCSYMKWDTIGILCAHAISCIFFNRQEAEQYVHRCFHVSTCLQWCPTCSTSYQKKTTWQAQEEKDKGGW